MVRLFRVFVPTSVVTLLLSEIILIFSCYILACFFALDSDPGVFLLYEGGLTKITVVVSCVMLGVYFHDLFTQFRIKSRILLIQQVCLVVGIAFLTQALLSYLKLPNWIMPRWVMILGSAFVLVFLPAWHVIYASVVMRALGSDRVLFLGASSLVQEISEHIAEHPEVGLSAIGYLDDCQDPGPQLASLARIGCIADLARAVKETNPDRIVVGMTER